jgi:hypothetical protein
MIWYLNHIQGKNCHLCVRKHSNTWVQSLGTFKKNALQCDGLQYYEDTMYDRSIHFQAFHSMVSTITLNHFLLTWWRCQSMEGFIGGCGKMWSISRASRKPSNNELMLGWKITRLWFEANRAWTFGWNGTILGGL